MTGLPLAFAVSESVTLRSDGGKCFRTPPLVSTTPAAAQAEFVRRVADAFARNGQTEGTVLLRGDMARRLGFPETRAEKLPAWHLSGVAAAGWKIGEPHPFTRVYGHPALPDVSIGVLPWIAADAGEYPLVNEDEPTATVALLGQFQALTGVCYGGMPALLAAAILKHHYEGKKATSTVPKWIAPACPVDPLCDRPITKTVWHNPEVRTPNRIDRESIDTNTAYLAAYGTGRQARYQLRATGAIPFDHTLSGYWRVELEPWNERRMPHPAGIFGKDETRVWLTTPTLKLLEELREDGFYKGFRVLDSWTSKGARVLDPMAAKLDALINTPGTAAPLVKVGKMAYQQFHGYLKTSTGLIHRPDWYSAVMAESRTMLWRRCWQAAHRPGGHYPVYLHVDAAVYRAGELPADSDTWADRDRPFKRGTGLGRFNPDKITSLKKGDPL